MDETVGLTEEDKELIQRRVGDLVGRPHCKNKSSLKTKFFTCLIITLVLVNGAFLYVKNQEIKQDPPSDTSVTVVEPEPEPEVIETPAPVPPVDTVSPKLELLANKVKELDLRTWMLGIAINENAYISRESAPPGNGMTQKYIQFDSHWKLNKMPEYLILPESDRKRLADLVKDNSGSDPNP